MTARRTILCSFHFKYKSMDTAQKEFLLTLCQALLDHTGTKEAILILRQKDSHRLQVVFAPDTIRDAHLKSLGEIILQYVADNSNPADQKISLKSRDGEAFIS